MQTVTIELTGNKSYQALLELENKHLIRIVDKQDLKSISLPGDILSEEDFKKWVENAENTPTVSLTEAKQKWEIQKKKLQNLIH